MVQQRYTLEELRYSYVRSLFEDVAKHKQAEERLSTLPKAVDVVPTEGSGSIPLAPNGRVLRAIAAYTAA